MKTMKILLGIGMVVFSILVFIACNKEDSNENENSVSQKSKLEKMDSFFGAKIAEKNYLS